MKIGKVQRVLLLEAADDLTCIAVPGLTRSKRNGRHIAARTLVGNGMAVKFRWSGRDALHRWRRELVAIELTDKGRAVVATFRRQLERGTRMRWSRFEAYATA